MKTSARIERIPFCLSVIFSLQLLLCRQARGTCLASEHLDQGERMGCVLICVTWILTGLTLDNLYLQSVHQWKYKYDRIFCICTLEVCKIKRSHPLLPNRNDHLKCIPYIYTHSSHTHVNTYFPDNSAFHACLTSPKAFWVIIMAFPFASLWAWQSGGNWFGQCRSTKYLESVSLPQAEKHFQIFFKHI